jgi:glycosyltransferase involved in cell wall biosynthesis
MDSSNQPAHESLAVDSDTVAGSRGDQVSRESRNLVRRKVFFLLDSLNVGGTETQAVELAIRLDSNRYDVTLGCLRARGPLLERLAGSTISVREFYPKGGFDSIHGMYQMFRLAIFLRRGGFRIVHTHDLYANVLGIPAAVIARVPVIISSQRDLAHLDLYRTRRRKWLRRLQRLSTAVLTNADAVRDAVLAENYFAPEKIHVIHNGVDMAKFSHALRDRAWLAQTGAKEIAKEKWIALVGNMHSDVKGHATLIAAAGEITREFPETRFVLMGDGEMRKEFERQVAELGLSNHFLFLGRRDDVPRILACCDIAVLPSRAEGLPNAVLEYLAVGLPTVATRVGGNAEIIRDGETGLLVPPADSSALAGALLRLLREPALRASLARNGRDSVASEFSFQKMIEKTDQLYTELLRARGVE